MSNEERKYLADIMMSIQKLDTHLQNKRDYKIFDGNITIQSAVRYEFSVIGEAVYELLKLKPDFELTDAQKIVGLRNKMVHEYNDIDNAQVWNIIVNYLPRLDNEVKELLKQ